MKKEIRASIRRPLNMAPWSRGAFLFSQSDH